MGALLMFPNQTLVARDSSEEVQESNLAPQGSETIQFPRFLSTEDFLDFIDDIYMNQDIEEYECFLDNNSQPIKMNCVQLAGSNEDKFIFSSDADDDGAFIFEDIFNLLEEVVDFEGIQVVNHLDQAFTHMVINHEDQTIIFY